MQGKSLALFFTLVLMSHISCLATKFVVTNRLDAPTWVTLKISLDEGAVFPGQKVDWHTKELGPIRPGASRVVKNIGENYCVRKIFLRHHKHGNRVALSAKGESTLNEYCDDLEFIIKEGQHAPYYKTAAYPKKIKTIPIRAKTIQLGHSLKNAKNKIKKIVSSSLFNNKQNLLFKNNDPLTINLGAITFPPKSTYVIDGNITVRGKSSPVHLENDKPTTMAMLKKTGHPITIKSPEKPHKWPVITIQSNKNENTLTVKNTVAHGIKRIEKLHVRQLNDYLKRNLNVLTHDNYVFFAGFPVRIYFDFTIDKSGKRIIDQIRLHALYKQFWHIAYSPYKKPPKQDFRKTINRNTLLKNKILHTRYI